MYYVLLYKYLLEVEVFTNIVLFTTIESIIYYHVPLLYLHLSNSNYSLMYCIYIFMKYLFTYFYDYDL